MESASHCRVILRRSWTSSRVSLALSSHDCQDRGWGRDPFKPGASRADQHHTMRTIGFRSNVLFAIAAAIGVIAALGRPWYAPAVAGDKDAQMESLLSGIGRAFTEPEGRAGWDVFTQADQLITGLAVATVVLLVLAMIPAIQLYVQALARWVGIATF